MSIPAITPHDLTYSFPKKRPEFRDEKESVRANRRKERSANTSKAKRDTDSRDFNRLSEGEQAQVTKLKARDAEVRRHEQAHLSGAGQYAVSGARFDYQTGPDGKNYAIGGEVTLDVAPVSQNPEATIAKMEQVKRAALAPERPSTKDRSIARQADRAIAKAKTEQQSQARNEADPGSLNPYSLRTTANITDPIISYLA